MIASERSLFNRNFSEEKYASLKQMVNNPFGEIPFRIAETPVFISETLKNQLLEAAESILKFIQRPDFKLRTENSIPQKWRIEGEGKHPHFMCLDFGLCTTEEGTIQPMLIELQGFPSLYGFQPFLANLYKEVYEIPGEKTPFLNNFTEDSYWQLLKEVIVGSHQADEVVLLDVDAPNQKTAIDFHLTKEKLGIEIVAFEDLVKIDQQLYYPKSGTLKAIKRIYNRLIFDEIASYPLLSQKVEIFKSPLDVEWVTHPNWFYRISKYTLPFLESPYVPQSIFLSELYEIPEDLENYVLKPLYSFAGKGVNVHITETDIQSIQDPENWILQKKMVYAPVIASPDGYSKAEIRLMYVWPENGSPQLCMNLARLSKGEMIGVNHNQDFNWVGGTVALFD